MDVRAAVKRLLDPNDGIGAGQGTDYVDGGFAADDAAAVCRAWLAEHPADDGDLPTAEWLRAVGFQQVNDEGDEFVALTADSIPALFIALDGKPPYAAGIGVEDDPWPHDIWTRGQVRDLCRCLGVKLNT